VAARLNILLEPVNAPGHFIVCASTTRNAALQSIVDAASAKPSLAKPRPVTTAAAVDQTVIAEYPAYVQELDRQETEARADRFSNAQPELLYIDPFLGQVLEPEVAQRHFLRQGIFLTRQALQPCDFRTMFMRMYANIMALYDALGDPLVALCISMSVTLHTVLEPDPIPSDNGAVDRVDDSAGSASRGAQPPSQRRAQSVGSTDAVLSVLARYRTHFTQADQVMLRNAFRMFRQFVR